MQRPVLKKEMQHEVFQTCHESVVSMALFQTCLRPIEGMQWGDERALHKSGTGNVLAVKAAKGDSEMKGQ